MYVPILGQFLTFALLLSLSLPANAEEDDALSRDLKTFGEFMEAGKLADAEAVLKKALPTPLAEPPKKPGQMRISVYGLSWAMLVSEHLKNNDQDNAARIATERVRVSEDAAGKDHITVAVFLNLLGSVSARQGKCDAALPVYQRSLRIHTALGLADGLIAKPVFMGLAECLLVQNRGAEAEALLHPLIHKFRGESRWGPEEDLASTYAVVLRETGNIAGAEQLEASIDSKSSSPPGFTAQTRDFLRARLMAARGDYAEAEVLYRKWIEHWERWGESVKNVPGRREWDRILMEPLQRYADFLASIRRKEDAAAIRQRLQGILTKYRIRGSIY